MSNLKFVYFGGEPLGVPVLEELKAAGYVPSLVVASPDRPVGRKQELTPPPVKVWAEAQHIPVWQPESFADRKAISEKLKGFDLFIVVAYNHILPEWLINLPAHKTLNVHPSLLPLLRGASPIRSAILEDMKDELGVSVMQLDSKMDHGPIVAQTRLPVADSVWPLNGPLLDEALARLGGSVLAASLPGYLAGDLVPIEQEHEYATYCTRFTAADGELILDPVALPTGTEAYQALLKIKALADAPGVFFMYNTKRIKIHEAHLDASGQLVIDTITPEGKNKQEFKTWLTHH